MYRRNFLKLVPLFRISSPVLVSTIQYSAFEILMNKRNEKYILEDSAKRYAKKESLLHTIVL